MDPLHEEAYMTVQIELSFHKSTLNIFYFNSHQNNYQDLTNHPFLANFNLLHLPNLVIILSPHYSFTFVRTQSCSLKKGMVEL